MFNRILAATDGSEHAQRALVAAGNLAARFEADVIVLNVFSHVEIDEATIHMAEIEHLLPGREPSLSDPDIARATTLRADPVYEAEKSSYMYRVAETTSLQLVDDGAEVVRKAGASKVRTVVRKGDPAEVILKVARDENIDLIVSGSRGLGTLKGLLIGSVSSKVNHLSDCCCLIVK